jgi:endonuclease/exonuclease/phosphatase family metal-dependent hydrolase
LTSAPKILLPFLAAGVAAAGGYALLRYLNFHPAPVQSEPVFNLRDAPTFAPKTALRVLTWNTQFLAGTTYHFFYDGGPDHVARAEDVYRTGDGIARAITRIDPDIVFLQEVDVGAKRSAGIDEVSLLRDSLPGSLRNYAATYYWRSTFVPHPAVWGPVGMKLVVFSKYRLGQARRIQLPLTPANPITQDFSIKRAILEVEIPTSDGRRVHLLNTHLEAFPGRTDIMKRQIDALLEQLSRLDREKIPWILGGDFNLLPPGQWDRLTPRQRGIHHEPSELAELFSRFQGVPTIQDAAGSRATEFFTFTGAETNSTESPARLPLRTLDYLFCSAHFRPVTYDVLQDDHMELSDHLPLLAEFGPVSD